MSGTNISRTPYRDARFHGSEWVILVPDYLKSPVLTNRKRVDLKLYKPEDKEELVRFYSSLSSETPRWALQPYDRARIERRVANLDHSIILLAVHVA